MATFEYKALTPDGKTKKGSIDGDSPRHARQLLRDQKLMPIDIKAIDEKSKTEKAGGGFFAPVIKAGDLALLTKQLHTLLDAGMPLAQSIKAVAEQAENKTVRRFLSFVHGKVEEGYSFADALTIAPFKVSQEYIATVKAGQESGHLVAVLSRISESILLQEKLNKKIKTALIYPAIMVVMSIAIVLFLMIYVVPKVVTVFDNMKQELPGLTQGLLDISNFLQDNWGILFIGFIGVVVAYKIMMRREPLRYKRDAILLSLPVLRRFIIYSSSARWARTLGVLLASGVPAPQALRISSEVMTMLPLRAKVLEMVEQVRKGESIADGMKTANFFPALLVNLVETGTGNGQVDSMLISGAEHYETEVENAATTLVSLIEPIMIMVMGGVVLTIVLAIMLPIFEMNQMVG